MNDNDTDDKLDDPHDYSSAGTRNSSECDEAEAQASGEDDEDGETDESDGEETTESQGATFSGDATAASNVNGGLSGTVTEGPLKAKSPSSSGGGVLSDGLSKLDSRLIIGSMVPCYALAAYVLWIAHLHGLHHTPLLVWAAFISLILAPLGIAFGPQFFADTTDSMLGRGSSNQNNRGG